MGNDARVDPGDPRAEEQRFRTTCAKADNDETTEKWAQPFNTKPLYTFFDDARQQEASKTKAQALADSKKKFTAHANFKLTRHPTGGVERLKGFQPGEGPEVGAADSWLDESHKKMEDPLRVTLAKELAQAKLGSVDVLAGAGSGDEQGAESPDDDAAEAGAGAAGEADTKK